MDIALDKSLEGFVAEQVNSGAFESATDLVNSAVRMQQEYVRRRDNLRREIQKGIDDVEAGRISYATADEIIAKARARMGLK